MTSGPLEPLNWSGSLLVDGSKDRALSPERQKPKKPHYSRRSDGSRPKAKQLLNTKSNTKLQRYCAFYFQTLRGII